MAQLGRPGLTAEQKREMWRRWRAGESLSEIGRAFGRHARSIHGVAAARGGHVPVPRRRSPRVRSFSEHEEISRGLADDRAWRRARRPKPCKLARAPRLCALVAEKLGEEWSPAQISGWRMACAHLRRRAGSAGVHRDHLPQPLRPGPRRARQGAQRTPAHQADDAALEEREPQGPGPRHHQGRGLDQRAPSGGRGPRRPRPLGGRPLGRLGRTRTSPPWSSARHASSSSSRWRARTRRRWSPR